MKKLNTWLKNNGFEISKEYNKTTNSMTFKNINNNQEYNINPEYNGNKISWYYIYKGSKYNNGKLIDTATTQDQIIDILKNQI